MTNGERRWLPRSFVGRVVLGCVLAAGLAFAGLQVAMRDRVAWGSTIAGLRLGGETRSAAEQQLERALERRGVAQVSVTTPRGTVRTSLSALGVRVDVAATIAAAVRDGRWRLAGLDLYWGRPAATGLIVRVDSQRFAQGVRQIAAQTAVPARDARLRLNGTSVRVQPARDGVELESEALQRGILAALQRLKPFVGPAPTAPAPPRVSTAQARAAAQAARIYVSRPLWLRYRGRLVVLSPRQLASMLTVNRGADAEQYPLTFDNPYARRELHRLFGFAETVPLAARVVLEGKHVRITNSRTGFVLDMPQLLGDMQEAAAQNGLRTVVVSLTAVQPSVTSEQLQEEGLSALGSEFSTYFDPHNTARAGNIALAARIVDGTVVKPGETFSLNATLGPRTVNRGFDVAPIISGGVLRQGVGGGVCQFATTLFNAAFFYGLPIVERHPHALFIDHYPIGRDATVAWGGPDLKFRNDTGSPFLIHCWAADGQLTVAIIGSVKRTVTYTTSAFRDVTQPSSSKQHPRVIYDDQLARGIISWERGGPGFSVTVSRTVSQGGTVLFRDQFVSTYAPKDWVERIGTKL